MEPVVEPDELGTLSAAVEGAAPGSSTGPAGEDIDWREVEEPICKDAYGNTWVAKGSGTGFVTQSLHSTMFRWINDQRHVNGRVAWALPSDMNGWVACVQNRERKSCSTLTATTTTWPPAAQEAQW